MSLRPVPFALTVLLIAALVGCSGSAPKNTIIQPPITISISPTSATLPAGGTQPFTAAVQGAADTNVTWQVNQVTGGSSATGIVDSTGLYTSPSVQSQTVFTVTAVAEADTSITASASVTVTPLVKVTVSPNNVGVETNHTQQFTATVVNTTNTAVAWQVSGVTGGNNTVGKIGAGGLYKAPGSVPAPATVTVKAISQADNTVTGTATVTVIAQLGVSISPPGPITISESGTQMFTATVVGDPLNQGVTWNLTCISDVESGGTPDCDGKSGDDGDGDISFLTNVTSSSVTFNAAPGPSGGGLCDENVTDCVLTLTATTVATGGSGAQKATVTITVP